MEVVFAEGWREPGVWSGEWNVGNIRRTKYLRGLIPAWKPLTTEYSIFHEGNRATTFLGPRSQKLATAEAAAFHSDYSWDMEGPFDAALMAKAPAALESWRAIGEYNRFLREHEDLYRNARPVSPIAVVAPRNGVTFTWDRDDSELYDLFAKNSILFDIRPAQEALQYAAVVIPPSAGSIPIPQGARVYSPRAGATADEILAGVRALVPEVLSVSVEDAPRVLANLTRLGSGKGLALHLLNYAPGAVSAVRVCLHLDREFAPLANVTPRVFTPDRAGQGAVRAHRTNLAIELSLDKLDVYSVVTLER